MSGVLRFSIQEQGLTFLSAVVQAGLIHKLGSGKIGIQFCIKNSQVNHSAKNQQFMASLLCFQFSVTCMMNLFSWLRTAASDNGCGVNLLALFLSASCVAIASCASAVAVVPSKMYAAAQRRL